jgi:transaldolase
MRALDRLTVQVFADGASLAGIADLAAKPWVKGFTTNPTLMRQAGIADYEAFAREALRSVSGRPISFEVFSDDFDEMEQQALALSGWGDNVFVKIPVTNTSGESSAKLIARLAEQGVKLNVTALLTVRQVTWVSDCLAGGPPCFLSLFAGRIADTGRDPVPMVAASVELANRYDEQSLIWASPREVLNIIQADAVGCHVITVTHDLLKKVELFGYDLDEFSLETVRMFRRDAVEAGYSI